MEEDGLFLGPPSTASMMDCDSDVVSTTQDDGSGGPPTMMVATPDNNNRRSSVALFVYEPKTGQTSTKLYIRHPSERHRSRLSGRERCLCTYSTFTTLALAFTLTLLFLHGRGVQLWPGMTSMTNVLTPSEEMCLTPDCMVMASRMLQKLNTSVDPCDDFYEYACGQWNEQARTPPGYIFWSTLNELTYTAFETMKNEYEKQTLDHTDAERKAIAIYSSCMDTDSVSRNGIEPLRQFLETLGGWSLVNPHKSYSNWSLADELNKVFSLGFMPIIWVGVVMDDRNTSRHVIGLDQAQVVLRGREQYLDLETGTRILHTNETPLVQLQQWVAYTAMLLGADAKVAEERAHRIVEFEARLAYAIPPKKFVPSLYHATTLGDLQKLVPMLDWHRFMGDMFQNHDDLDGDQEPVLVYGWDWLKNLSALLIEYSSTEEGRRTLDDYIKWYVAFRLTPSLDRHLFNDSVQPLFNLLLGLITSPPRWLECAMQTEAMMSLAVSSMYIKLRSGAADVRHQASQLVAEMTAEIRHHLRHVTWLDESTKARALRKIENIIPMVGFSDQLLEADYLNRLYGPLIISETEYFDNTVAAFGLARRLALSLLRKPPNRIQWDASTAPVHVNAYYGFPLNRIIFPLAILQSPVFNSQGPATINYAMIGSIIGHELVHAFDDTGKEYDDNGNLNRWWSPPVYETSAARGRCLIEQYNNYTYEGMQLDGVRTLNENVADFDGLNIAYNAFKRSLSTRHHYTLPGLNMTSEQLFFVSYAQLWCSKAALPQFRRLQITADMHSVEKYRVIGPLSNFAPFSKLYQCPLGSAMNPKRKCNVH